MLIEESYILEEPYTLNLIKEELYVKDQNSLNIFKRTYTNNAISNSHHNEFCGSQVKH